jgi:hypothetical protein
MTSTLFLFTPKVSPVGIKCQLKGKGKELHYRPGQTQSVPGGRDSQISRQSTHEGGMVVIPTHRPPLPTRKDSWYSFLLETEPTTGP